MYLPWALVLILGLMLQVTAPAETAAPLLTMDPPWVRFLTGDRITLHCKVGKELRSTKYVWNITGHGDIPGNRTYFIDKATKNDSGGYKCKAISSATRQDGSYSNTILVNITDPDPLMKIEVQSENLWVDQSLVLRCEFRYFLKNEHIYTFYREGSALTEIRSWNKNVTFEVEHVTLEHKGRYRCQALFVEFPDGPVYSSGYKTVRVREKL